MAYIETVPDAEADGALRRVYEASRKRDRRVAEVIRVLSQNPPALERFMALYGTIAYGPSGLSRAQREMIAIVVSKTNGCHY
jgi:uncharacterized peroxidase-related enzyme